MLAYLYHSANEGGLGLEQSTPAGLFGVGIGLVLVALGSGGVKATAASTPLWSVCWSRYSPNRFKP